MFDKFVLFCRLPIYTKSSGKDTSRHSEEHFYMFGSDLYKKKCSFSDPDLINYLSNCVK